jgi:transcription elongation factor GreA-like protein
MPRKQQGWITFQSSLEEMQLLEQYCKQSQRTKTDVLRSLLRSLQPKLQQQQGKQSDSSDPDLNLF